jgi:hypothetical protein
MASTSGGQIEYRGCFRDQIPQGFHPSETWAREPFTFMHKQFDLSDGSTWKPKRVERPFVLTNKKGRAEWLYLAVLDEGFSGNIAVPIKVGNIEKTEQPSAQQQPEGALSD